MAAAGWTFLTNHAHVVALLARDPGVRLRDLAERIGITERAVSRILAELAAAGIVSRVRRGRRNAYSIRAGARLRHPVEAHRTVGDLLRLTRLPPGGARAHAAGRPDPAAAPRPGAAGRRAAGRGSAGRAV